MKTKHVNEGGILYSEMYKSLFVPLFRY